MLQALSRLVAGLGIICTALCVDAGELASLELETNGLVYDSLHNLIYATVPGSVPKVGNHVVALDPETLEVVDLVYVGSRAAQLRRGGALRDLAPTLLDLLGLDKPAEMTGATLLVPEG